MIIRKKVFLIIALFTIFLYNAQGTDLLIVVDESASMSNEEFNKVQGYIKDIAKKSIECNSDNRVALVSYAYNFAGTNVIIDADFTNDISKLDNFNHRGVGNVADYAPRTFRAIGDALDGVDNKDIKSSQKTLNRTAGNDFVVFFFTDANRDGGLASSYLVETGNGDPFKVYNDFKTNRKASFVVLKGKAENVFQVNPSIAAAAAIASVGGTWTGSVEKNAGDPEGNGTTPRKMVYTEDFSLTLDQLQELYRWTCSSPRCYKPATTAGTVLNTYHGITSLARAGASGKDNWPMVRKGAWTAIESKTKGFVLNRIPTTAQVNAIANPLEGMLVYDVEADCLKINVDGTAAGWKCLNTQTCQ